MEDYRDEADAAEDLEHEPDVQATEIPEADALEQASESIQSRMSPAR